MDANQFKYINTQSKNQQIAKNNLSLFSSTSR
nr:MAG TPA: hypothetical protein [Bacteriophage sp.]